MLSACSTLCRTTALLLSHTQTAPAHAMLCPQPFAEALCIVLTKQHYVSGNQENMFAELCKYVLAWGTGVAWWLPLHLGSLSRP